MEIINGLPHTPYLIFIKDITNKSDPEILKLIELEGSREIANPDYLNDKDCIYMSRDNKWVHLMDNYFYTYWHSKKLSDKIDKLGMEYEIFTCSVGDCDESFNFKYYKEGNKVREYVVESPNYIDEILKVNYGTSLKGENEGLKKKEPFDRVMYIAHSLGIQVPKAIEKIKCHKIDAV